MSGILALFGFSSVAKDVFAFNLLPPKSKEEIEEEAKKMRMLSYAIITPVACLVLSLILFLINVGYVDGTESAWKAAVDSIKKELSDPNNALGILKVRNGELKVKTDFIAEPIEKNVDFEQVFQVTDSVFQANAGNVLTSYGRQDTGEFLVNATSRSSAGASQVLETFKKQPQISDANLILVQKPQDEPDYRYTISFVFRNLDITPTDVITTQ